MGTLKPQSVIVLECGPKHKIIRILEKGITNVRHEQQIMAENADNRSQNKPNKTLIYNTTKQRSNRLAIYLQRKISNHVDKPLTRVHFQNKM